MDLEVKKNNMSHHEPLQEYTVQKWTIKRFFSLLYAPIWTTEEANNE